jgi:hypothetical protein
MSKYELTVIVEYVYEVEADSREEAEKQGFDYEDYQHNGTVDSIRVFELEDDDEDEDDE